VSVTLQPPAATSRPHRLAYPKRLERGVMAAIAIWPLLFHFPVAFRVWHGGYQHIGNDFAFLYYPYKPYLLAGLANGHVPLWMPQEASGFAFALNPFTQTLYPGNLLILPIALLLGHWGPLEHQWFALSAISVLGVSLYLFLRKLSVGLPAAALAALVVASSYKVTETLRFPNATHAIACAAVAVLAITYLRVTRRIGARVGLAALLALAIFSLATAGYPYFFVYFFLVLPPLLVWLELGAPAAYRAQHVGVVPYIATTLASIGVALVAVWPYLSGMRHVLAETTDRAGGDWAYSTAHHFDGLNYTASLLLPDRSSFEGWFYFGTAGLVVVALALFVVAREEGLRRHLRLIAATSLWIGWVVFFGLNASNPLFRIAWETLPVIDTMRVWGRINIFLVFPLAIVLGLALDALVRRFPRDRLLGEEAQRGVRFAALTAIVIAGLQVAMMVGRPEDPEFVGSMKGFYYVPSDVEYIAFTVVIAGVLAYALRVMRRGAGRVLLRVQGLCAVLAFVWLWQIHGAAPWSWMWLSKPDPGTPQPADIRVGPVSYQELATTAFHSRRTPPEATPIFTPGEPWTTGVYDNWHFQRYVRFLKDPRIPAGVKDRVLGVTSTSRLFFVAGPPDPDALDRGAVQLQVPRAVSVAYYDGSRLVADVRVDDAGALVFADNWDDGWSAKVDGKPTRIELAFGTFKSVRVARGRSRVEFSYCPFSAPVYRSLC
jgi:hypothetical protein